MEIQTSTAINQSWASKERRNRPLNTIWCPQNANQWEQTHSWSSQNDNPQIQRHGFKKNFPKNNRKTRKSPVFIGYCDVCDRGFKNVAKKSEHFQQHTKCDEPGCSYEAHFKIVAIHKQNVHGPNSQRIKLDTPDEIKRWREERKRKYPSKSNIQSKLEKQAQDEAASNVLKNKYFGKVRQRKLGTVAQQSTKETSSSSSACLTENTPSLLFSNISNESGEISSGEENQADITTADSNCSIGLGSLMQNYASSSDSEAAAPLLDGNVKAPNSPVFTNDCTPKKIETVAERSAVTRSHTSKAARKKIKKSPYSKGNSVRKVPSLLEMLLAPDIRRERNQILQCVRYIVRNDFLEQVANSQDLH